MTRRHLVLAAAYAVGLASCDVDQRGLDTTSSGASVPSLSVGEPLEAYAEPFSDVGALEVVSDCQIGIADPTEEVVQVINLRLSDAMSLGRVGHGPGEFARVDGLLHRADSLYVLDRRNLRLQPFSTGGGAGDPIRLPTTLFGSDIRAIDAAGRLYLAANPLQAHSASGAGAEGGRRGLPLLRHDLVRGNTDTLATLLIPPNTSVEMTRRSEGSVSHTTIMIPQPFGHTDAWALSATGEVIVLRSNPYRLERLHQGSWKRFPALDYKPVAVDDADKEVDAFGADLTWPEYKQPFVATSILADPGGGVWVRRQGPAEAELVTYDVLSPSGKREAQVTLHIDRRIRAVAEGRLYVIRRGEYDLKWLEIYDDPTDHSRPDPCSTRPAGLRPPKEVTHRGSDGTKS